MTSTLDHIPLVLRRPVDALARAALFRALRELQTGRLTIEDGSDVRAFGARTSPLSARVVVHDPRFYLSAASGSVGAGQAYINGWWSSDRLSDVVRVLAENSRALDQWRAGFARVASPVLMATHAMRRNTRSGARRNIAAHYDLGDDFFALFLDDTLTYSSGIFPYPGATLREASVEKLDRVCRKLRLSARDCVLEIGTGWGSFALHAAQTYGCHVTTTTISTRQYEYARRRVSEAGLEDRIHVIKQDYRELTGTFDKLVSIEMIEAVGHQYFDAFFSACAARLTSTGAMLLQSIVIDDRCYEQALSSVDYIKKFVFPGCTIPSVAALQQSWDAVSDLRPTQLEPITEHYADTLRAWRARFLANRDQVRALGFDESFLNLWDFYLAYCEGGFRAGRIGVVQLLLSKPEAEGYGEPRTLGVFPGGSEC